MNILPYREASKRRTYRAYKYNAKAKSLCFTLTLKQFEELVRSKCIYCGAVPKQYFKRIGTGDNGKFLCNGIDRINNAKGYTLKNCVPCCGICNHAKGTMTRRRFKAWLRKVADYVF